MLVSGMVIGTVLRLYVVPAIYLLVARTRTATVDVPAVAAEPALA